MAHPILRRLSRSGRAMIEDPILRGFHRDPNILRVGDDSYIVTSTVDADFDGFEYRELETPEIGSH